MIQLQPLFRRRILLVTVLCALLLLPEQSEAQRTPLTRGVQLMGIHSDSCFFRGEEASYRIHAPARIQQTMENMQNMSPEQLLALNGLQTAEIVFEFGPGFALLGPDEQAAKDAFEFAASIWEMEVVSTVPIVIEADFLSLGGGVIGFNGSPRVFGVPGAPDPTVAYTSALANAIAGFDVLPGQPDGSQGYNSDFTFYFGTDGNTPPGVIDFATVVLHEIGHSMGIFGEDNSGAGVGLNGGANPMTWDLLVELGDGTPIVDLGFGTAAQQAALVSDDLFINGPLATAALGGTRPKIWAPNPTQPGSSYSHWDEFEFPPGDPNSLMTPFAESGASNFNIGDITRGVLADQGWTLSTDLAAQDVGIDALASPISSSDLTNAETISVIVRNYGIEAAQNFDVSYSIDGGAPITETFNMVIDPVSSMPFTFATTADFSVDGQIYNLELSTNLVGDQDNSNDVLVTQVANLIPSVDVPVTDLNFGPIGVGDLLTFEVPVVNDGAGPLAGEVVLLGLGFNSPVFSSSATFPLVILPGETYMLPLTFQPAALGAESGTATLSTNAGADINISLTGEGVDPASITVAPTTLAVELEIGQETSEVINIANNGAADLNFSISSVNTTGGAQGLAASFQGQTAVRSSETTPLRSKPIEKQTVRSQQLALNSPDDFVYILDDGSGENGLGIGSEFDLMWLNAFTTTSGAAIINAISSAIAEGPASTTARFLLYEDPNDDGNPDDAVLLQDITGQITNPGTDMFSTVEIPPTPVSNVFFVGVLVTSSGFPIPLDQTTSQGASWVVASGGAGTMNVNDLLDNTIPIETLVNVGFPGNAMVRADGQFFSFAPASGTVAQGEQVAINIDFAAISPGLFTADLVINSNDPSSEEVVVPISMEVEGVQVTADPASFDVALPQGATTTESLTLTNGSNTADLTYSIAVEQTDGAGVASLLGAGPMEPREVVVSRDGPARLPTGLAAKEWRGGKRSSNVLTNELNVGTPQYSTGFEDLLLGDITNQDGWIGEFGLWRVDNVNPANGDQHMAVISDGFGFTVCQSPVVPPGSDPLASFSTLVNIPGGGVSWQFVPVDINTQLVVTRVVVEPDRSISALVDDGFGGAVFVPTGAFAPVGYFQLALEVERATFAFTIYVDGNAIYSDTGFAGNIDFMGLISLMEEPGPSMDLDDFQILDGEAPSTGRFVTPDPISGTLPAGGSVDISLLFDADRAFGTYQNDLVVTFNDNPDIPQLVVPATLTVEGPPMIEVTPTVLAEDVNFNAIETRPLALKNTGGEPVTFDLTVFGAEASMAAGDQLLMSPEDEAFRSEKMRTTKYRENERLIRTPDPGKNELKLTTGAAFFTENFEGAFPPAGWSVLDNEGTGVQWVTNAAAGLGNFSGAGNAPSCNSDAFFQTEFDTELITPAIDVTGRENVSLEFTANYLNYQNRDFLDVDITTDGGATWVNMLSWNEIHGTPFSLPGERVSIDLEPYLGGATSIQIRWHYYDPGTLDWDFYAQIDDVQLLANTEVWFTATPASGTIPVGETLNVAATFDASVVDVGQYVAGVVVNSNATNAPVVGVVVIMNELEPPVINVDPTEIEEDVIIGEFDVEFINVENLGVSELEYRVEREFENVGGTGLTQTTGLRGGELVRELPTRGTPSSDFIRRPYLDGNAVTAASTPVYATNFENLSLGPINGQDTWFSPASWDVSNLSPAGGTQHLRSESDGSQGLSFAFSPYVGIGSEAQSSFSVMVRPTPGASWEIAPQSPTAGFLVTSVVVDPGGNLFILDANQGAFLFVTTLPDFYVEVGVTADRATGAFTLFLDGFPAYSGQGFAGDIEEVVFVGYNDAVGSVLNADNFRILDGELPPSLIRTFPNDGIVPSGGFTQIAVEINTSNVPVGVYEETLTIISNDLTNPEVPVNITVNVVTPASITVDPAEINATLPILDEGSTPLTVGNEGGADLAYSIQIVGAPEPPQTIGIANAYDWKSQPEIVKKLGDKPANPAPTFVSSSVIQGSIIPLLTEDFESGVFPPAGWQAIDNKGTGLVWGLAADFRGANFTGGTGEAATADSDWFGPSPYDTELRTAEIATNGETGLTLEYLANYQNFGPDFLDTDISTDGGVTWTTMLSWNDNHGGFLSTPGERVSLPLDPYLAGAESFMIRWHYYNPEDGFVWDWYAQIDDVLVGKSWISVNPAAGIVDGSAESSVDILYSSNSLPPGTYDVDIAISSNDPVNPLTVVPFSLEVIDVERVESFTLVNSKTNQDLRELDDNDVINLFEEGTDKISIRANTIPSQVGSVKFDLSGKKKIRRTENFLPYALLGDKSGDYKDWKPKKGHYSLTATPFTESNGGGEAGWPLTINFEVIDENNATITYYLIDADTDQEVGPLEDGDIINLEDLGLTNISIEARTDPSPVGSVKFKLSGKKKHKQTENVVPYALFGDKDGDFKAWKKPKDGEYKLYARAYEKPKGKGKKTDKFEIEFVIQKESDAARETPVEVTEPEVVEREVVRLQPQLVPNPIPATFEIWFNKEVSGEVGIQLINTTGQVLVDRVTTVERSRAVSITPQNSLKPGIYFVRVRTSEGVSTIRAIKQ